MSMTIAQLQQLNRGVSGLQVSGVISDIQAVYHNTGTRQSGAKKGQPYDFWTQRATFTDAEGTSCPVEFNPKSGDTALTAADEGRTEMLTVRTDEYNGIFRLKANMVVPKAKPSQQISPAAKTGKTDNVDWDAKDLRQARMAGLKAATALLIALAEAERSSLSMDALLDAAEELVSYIYKGRPTVSEPVDEEGPSEMPTGDDIPF